MAIGKVNAYATVQAPNVDFGEIALNAQKFQDADIEKQKELKVAQLKADAYKKSEDVKLDPSNIINGTIRANYNRNIDKAATRLQQLADIKANRSWTNDEITENQNLNSLAKTLKNRETLINEGLKSLPSMIEKSSMLSSNEVDAYEGLASGKGLYVDTNSSSDDVNIYVWKRDKDGNLTKREDGEFGGYEPITRVNDKGEEEPLVITGDSIATGDFKKQFYQKNDIDNAIPKMFAEGAGLYSSTNENGFVTIHTKGVNKSNIDRVELNIKNRVNEDSKLTGDVLAQTAISRGEDPKEYSRIPKGGWSDSQKQQATNILFNRTKARFDSEYSKSEDESGAMAARKEGQEQEKYKYTIGRSSHAQGELGGSISRDVEKTSFGFPLIKVPMVSVKAGNYFNKKGEAGKIPLPPGSYFTDMTLIQRGNKEIPAFVVQQLDAKSSREVQNKINDLDFGSMNLDQQQEATNIILSSYGNKYTQHIYTFSKEDSDNILKQQTLGANKGAGYNTQFAIETLRNAQPKEKVNKQQSNQAKSVSVGDVVGGYKYLGGDTSNKNSWLLIRDK